MTADALEALEPASLWRAFARISTIPRPPRGERAVASHVRGWARSQGFSHSTDAAGNIVVDVPGSPGVATDPLALQAHLDMVCEVGPDATTDPAHDGVSPRVDEGWVRASGTTLGADNGIGVVAAMAAATDPELIHPPLQLVFTVSEEIGLIGASAIDPQLVHAKTLVNLDSEEDAKVYVGCAGGARVGLSVPVDVRPAPPGLRWQAIEVGGLAGGHSGLDIANRRGNAIKLLARVLDHARASGIQFALASISGGRADNAIPREATAVLGVAANTTAELADLGQQAARGARSLIRAGNPTVALHDTDVPPESLECASRDRLIDLLVALPHGVLAMSDALPGLVETSVNLGVVETSAANALVTLAPRSSSEDALDELLATLAGHARLAGASTRVESRYPGWEPRPDTRVVEATRRAYRRVYGDDPEVLAVHGGLECGALAKRLGGVEMVSFGPEIRGAHTPGEAVEIASVQRFWAVLGALLGDYASATDG